MNKKVKNLVRKASHIGSKVSVNALACIAGLGTTAFVNRKLCDVLDNETSAMISLTAGVAAGTATKVTGDSVILSVESSIQQKAYEKEMRVMFDDEEEV